MQRFCALLACLVLVAFPVWADKDVELGGHVWDSVIDLLDSKNGTQALWAAVQEAEGALDVDELADGNWTGTIFAPMDSAFDAADVEALLASGDTAQLASVLAYHIIPGQALTLAELQAMDGQLLNSTLDAPAGQLKVKASETMKKAALLTTSGQQVAIYQYDLVAGQAIVHTIKQVLIPGNEALKAERAPTPAPAPATGTDTKAGSGTGGKCTYTVVSGDFFYGIADKFKIDAAELQKLNPQIVRIESLATGLELNVPC